METFIFYALFPYGCFPFLRWVKFCSSCFGQVFFNLGNKKVVAGCVRLVIILPSNNFMGMCLGRLSTGRLRRGQGKKLFVSD